MDLTLLETEEVFTEVYTESYISLLLDDNSPMVEEDLPLDLQLLQEDVEAWSCEQCDEDCQSCEECEVHIGDCCRQPANLRSFSSTVSTRFSTADDNGSITTSSGLTNSSSTMECDPKIRLDNKRKKQPAKENPKQRSKLLSSKHCSVENTALIFAFACKCKQQCAEQFSLQDMKILRQAHWMLNGQERQQALLQKLYFDMVADYETQTINFRYVINGKQVCGPFFCAAYRISNDAFAIARKMVTEKEFNALPKSGKANAVNLKFYDIYDFLREYVDEHGSAIPNRTIINMPDGLSRQKLYVHMLSLVPLEQLETRKHAGISYFYKVSEREKPFFVSNFLAVH